MSPTPRDVLASVNGNYMTRPVKEPAQPWDELLISAKEMAEGAFDLIINEDFGFYIAWEKMGPEKEKRIKHLLAEYLEKEILERD